MEGNIEKAAGRSEYVLLEWYKMYREGCIENGR